MFHIADYEMVKRGEVVDVYFIRTKQVLEAKGLDARVKAELMCKGLPRGWDWAVLAGLEEAASLLSDLDIKV
ncbi:MAG: nicotinate phosphoribosyltransferase, partial [Deltaproteobacteria bacterium]|nr:nicotinate phosphoribosyltransferase [Deltaproteobacteria bacterium]